MYAYRSDYIMVDIYNVFVGSLPQFFNAWVDYLLYLYDLSLKSFFCGLIELI